MTSYSSSKKLPYIGLLAFPAIGMGFHLVSPLWTALCGFAALFLLYFLTRARYSHLLLLGVWGAGIIAYAITLSWLPQVIQVFAEFSITLAIVSAIAMYSVGALQFVVFFFLLVRLRSLFLTRYALTLPCSWLAAEILFPQYIPWSLGSLFLYLPILPSAAELLGVSLVGFLAFWWSQVLLSQLANLKQRHPASLGAVLTLFATVALSAYRSYDLPLQAKNAPSLTVGLVQGNLDPLRDFSPERLEANLNRYRHLSAGLLRESSLDLLIWPESSVGHDYFVGQKNVVRGTETDPFPGLHVMHLFGGQLRARINSGGKPEYWMAAHLMNPAGDFLGQYRKRLLFPFSERIPGQDMLPILSRLNKSTYRLLAGSEELPLTLFTKAGTRATLAVAICFEDLQSWPTFQLQQRKPIQLIVTLSNDNWFLDSIAAEQHNFLASWRAIEFRRYLVRATNDGYSTLIDPEGRVKQSLPVAEEGSLLLKNTPLLSGVTLFSIVGDLPLQFFAVAVVILALFRRGRYVAESKKI